MSARSAPSDQSAWKTSSPSTGTFTQSCDGAAVYGMDEGIRPARTMTAPIAASQRASAPTAATEAESVVPAATASQLRRLSTLIRVVSAWR